MLALFEILEENQTAQQRKFALTQIVKDKASGDKFVLKSAPLLDTKALSILKNEANYSFENDRLQSSLKSWEEEGQFYVLKEYLSGEPLSSFYKSIRRRKRKFFVVQLMQQLSLLLDEIHALGLVHLDIKPSNIIIEGSSEDLKVKIIDFGLTWNYQTPSKVKRKSYYPFGRSAPELILNAQEILLPATDYYALGILLYELMEGELPLQHANPVQSINMQLNLPLDKLSWKWRKFQHLVDRLTAKEAFKRPPIQLSSLDQYQVLFKGIKKRYNNLDLLRADLENIYSVS